MTGVTHRGIDSHSVPYDGMGVFDGADIDVLIKDVVLAILNSYTKGTVTTDDGALKSRVIDSVGTGFILNRSD